MTMQQHGSNGGVTLAPEVLGAAPVGQAQRFGGVSDLAAMLPPVDASSRDISRLDVASRRLGEMIGSQINQQGQSRAIYAWTAGGSRVEGPTVYLIEALAHEYGQLWTSLKIDHDGGDIIYVTATVVDRVKGNVYQRPHVHEISPPPGKFANNQEQAARWRTMQLQKAFSKAMRTTLEHALPRWYIDTAVEAAKAVVTKKVGDPKKAREEAATYFLREFGVELPELEEHLGAEKPLWTASDILALKELIKALKNAQTTLEAVFGPRGAEKDAAKAPAKAQTKAGATGGLAGLTDKTAEQDTVEVDEETGEVIEPPAEAAPAPEPAGQAALNIDGMP